MSSGSAQDTYMYFDGDFPSLNALAEEGWRVMKIHKIREAESYYGIKAGLVAILEREETGK